MRIEEIDSLADPRVADFRNVRDAELRAESVFLVEGRNHVRRLVEASRFPVRAVFVTPTALGALRSSLERLPDSVPVYRAPQPLLNAVVGYDLHRGCLASAARRDLPGCDAVLPGRAGPSRVAVLEQLANPDNVGGVFRNAAAFGADAVLLCPRTCDPLYRKAVRVSLGAVLTLPFARLADWPAGLARLRERGYELVALDPGADTELERAPLSPRSALLLGTEGEGLSAAALAAADRRVRIAMAPGVDSINVATAAGIALYELARRHLRGAESARESA